MSPPHTTFTTMVEGEKDVLGMIAYCFYKLHKLEYCNKIERQQKRPPTEEEMENFIASITDQQLENYQQRSIRVIQSFLTDTIAAEIDEAISENKKEYQERLEQHISKLKPTQPTPYWVGLSQSFIASVLFVMFVFLLAIFFSAIEIDLIGGAKDAANTVMEQALRETPSE